MATADQVKAMVKSHAEGDDTRFYSVALQVAAGAARQGQNRFAQDLRDLVDTLRTQQGPTSTASRPVPVVQPRGELAQLLTGHLPAEPPRRPGPRSEPAGTPRPGAAGATPG